jgi:hypothetical protein
MKEKLNICKNCTYFVPQSKGTGFGYCNSEDYEELIVEETFCCEDHFEEFLMIYPKEENFIPRRGYV